MIYLDANIFIYSVLNTNKEGQHCRNILTKIAKKDLVGYTSFLTWDEFIYILKKHVGREAAAVGGEKFLNFPNLIFLKADRLTIEQAQQLIAKYNINSRDAIHTATALINNINQIVSDDQDFDKIKEIKRITLEKFK